MHSSRHARGQSLRPASRSTTSNTSFSGTVCRMLLIMACGAIATHAAAALQLGTLAAWDLCRATLVLADASRHPWQLIRRCSDLQAIRVCMVGSPQPGLDAFDCCLGFITG